MLQQLALCICITLVCNLHAQDKAPPQSVSLTLYEYMPFMFKDARGEPRGIVVDMWKLWSLRTGIAITFESVSWQESLEAVKSGRIDIHSGLFYTADRAEYLDYCVSFYTGSSDLFYRSNWQHSPPHQIQDLLGLKIGGVKSDAGFGLAESVLPAADLRGYKEYEELIQSALKGEVQAFIMEAPVARTYLAKHGGTNQFVRAKKPIRIQPWFSAVQKGNHHLEEIVNTGFAKITKKDIAQILESWGGASSAEFIVSPLPHHLTVAYPDNSFPMAFADETGAPTGLAIELWLLWSAKTGIPVDFVGVAAGETMNAVIAGKAQAIAYLPRTPEHQAQFSFPVKIADGDIHLFFHKSVFGLRDLRDAAGFRIGVVKGSYLVDKIRTGFPDATLFQYANLSALMEAARDGKVRVFVESRQAVLGFLRKLDMEQEFRYHPERPLYRRHLYAAIGRQHPEFNIWVKRGMSKITRAERSRIEAYWFGHAPSSDSGALSISIYGGRPPLTFVTPDGQPAGMLVDFWKLWSRKTGRPIRFRTDSWEDTIAAVRQGSTDIHSGLFRTEERDISLAFTQPFYSMAGRFYYLAGDQEITDFTDIPEGRCGALIGTYEYSQLEANLPPERIKGFSDLPSLFRSIQKGEVSAGVVDELTADYHLRTLGLSTDIVPSSDKLYERLLHGAVSKNRSDLVATIEDGLNAISDEEFQQIETRWIPPTARPYYHTDHPRLHLNSGEKRWLMTQPTIRIAIPLGMPPLGTSQEKEEPEGVFADYANLVSERTGLKAELISMTWPQLIAAAEAREIDAFLGIPSEERGRFMDFTSSFFKINYVIINRTDTPFIQGLKAIRQKRISVIRNVMIHSLLKQQFPDMTVIPHDTLKGALLAVSIGEVDAYVGDLITATHQIRKANIANVKIAAATSLPEAVIAFATRKDWPHLGRIAGKGVRTFTPGDQEEIQERWLSVTFDRPFPWELIRTWVFGITVGVLLFVGVTLFWNRRLAAEVNSRKQAEAALTNAKASAESASEAKSIFLANMSHEIRTPMNAILGFSQLLLRDTEIPPHLRQRITTINDSGEHLLALINDILEVSKIEAGRVTITPTVFRLESLLNALASMLQERAQAKGIILECDFAKRLPKHIETDEAKLRQVLINVLNNAIKFTKHGSVTFAVELTDENTTIIPGQEVGLSFVVADTGSGISIADQQKIFRPFEQSIHPAPSNEGTGLGLTITQKYVELLGGQVELQSVPGEGSTFTVKLPILCRESSQEPKVFIPIPVHLAPDQKTPMILIADDVGTNRELLAEMLQPRGFNVVQAADGEEVLELIAPTPPDLILMDRVMPHMDGIQATREIRRLEEVGDLASPIKIIAISASVFEKEREEVLKSGADDFILKPFKEAELFDLIGQQLGVRYIYEESSPVKPQTQLRTRDLTKEIARLPDDLRSKLRNAATIGHVAAMRELIPRVQKIAPDLSDLLERHAQNYDYAKIVHLLNIDLDQ